MVSFLSDFGGLIWFNQRIQISWDLMGFRIIKAGWEIPQLNGHFKGKSISCLISRGQSSNTTARWDLTKKKIVRI